MLRVNHEVSNIPGNRHNIGLHYVFIIKVTRPGPSVAQVIDRKRMNCLPSLKVVKGLSVWFIII